MKKLLPILIAFFSLNTVNTAKAQCNAGETEVTFLAAGIAVPNSFADYIQYLIGEELINENLEQFIGEYSKQINLTNNGKGIYFLEIEMDDGIINKKLILQ